MSAFQFSAQMRPATLFIVGFPLVDSSRGGCAGTSHGRQSPPSGWPNDVIVHVSRACSAYRPTVYRCGSLMPFPFHMDGSRPLQANWILIDTTTPLSIDSEFPLQQIVKFAERSARFSTRIFNARVLWSLDVRIARPWRDQTLNYFCQRRSGLKGNKRDVDVVSS